MRQIHKDRDVGAYIQRQRHVHRGVYIETRHRGTYRGTEKEECKHYDMHIRMQTYTYRQEYMHTSTKIEDMSNTSSTEIFTW